MPDVTSTNLTFRPRARIIRTIGDQLISGPEAAIIELVKNAYDADASYVKIKFSPPLRVGLGRITISDDGQGMTLTDIQEKWMEPATASKSNFRLTPKRGRRMMGSKGIGRFAAAKLGNRMALLSVSVASGSPVEVLIPEIDWNIFNSDTYLSDVTIGYITQPSQSNTGTTIEVTELSEQWSESKLNRLHLELRRLVSPISDSDSDSQFKIYLDLAECTRENSGFDGVAMVRATASPFHSNTGESTSTEFEVQPFPLLTTSDYAVNGSFDAEGRFTGTMEIKRAGQAPKPIDLKVQQESDEESCGEFNVHLFLFDREASVVRENVRKAGLGSLTSAEARRILDSVSGIAVYRNGFRIRPYGDPENDWLVLDKRRVQNPSLRLGHNQVAGYIVVQDQTTSGLFERSSREGFEQNASFRRLQRLVTVLLAQVVEPRRTKFREDAGLSRKRSVSFDEVRSLTKIPGLDQLTDQLTQPKREKILQLIDSQSEALAQKIDLLEERQRVLEAQSSLGQIIGEILHEGAPRARFLATTGKRLKYNYQHLFDNSERTVPTKEEFPAKLALITENAEKLSQLFVSLQPLSGGKRGPPDFFVGPPVAHGVFGLFSSHSISMHVHEATNLPKLFGYADDLNTAFVNLVGNSVHWLEHSKTEQPRIDIRFRAIGDIIQIFVEDNGPGIPAEFAEQIFDVGFTLKDAGTGLGLNIAKEALSRSDANLIYHLDFEGGTRFEIRFPVGGRI